MENKANKSDMTNYLNPPNPTTGFSYSDYAQRDMQLAVHFTFLERVLTVHSGLDPNIAVNRIF